jgi:hypothetical protein
MNLKHVKSSVLLLMLVSIILSVAVQIGSVNAQGADFAVTISPPRATIGADGVATYSVRVSSINGFSGTVALSTDGLSQRTNFQSTPSFQPSVLVVAPNSDVYSILTVTVSAPYNYLYPSGYQAGQQYTYYYPYGATISFNVVASSGDITKKTAVNLDILAYYTYSLDISVNLNPGSILLSGDITQTVTEQLTITATGQNVRGGDVISVTPQLYDLPNGLSASFSPGSGQITASGQSVVFTTTLLMTPDFLAKSGTYRLAAGITAFLPTGAFGNYYNYGSYSGYYRTGLFKAAILTVVVPPFITISTNPSILNVYIGGTDQVMQITVNTLSSGNISPISLGVQGVPQGVITNLQNSILTPTGGQPATTNLVFNAPSTFASGIFPITISATAFGVTKYANASIYIRPQGGFALTASEQQIAMVPSGDTHAVTITIQPQGGFRATVQLSVTQLPPGVSASLSTDTVTVQSDSPVPVVLTLVASTKAVPGTYSVAVVAGTGISQTTTNITLVIRSGTSQIWPIVFLVVVLVGVASAISFIAIPRGKHVHVVRQG